MKKFMPIALVLFLAQIALASSLDLKQILAVKSEEGLAQNQEKLVGVKPVDEIKNARF